MSHRLAVDIGGTFVDAIVFNPDTGALRLEKDFATPDDASRGVLSAIDRLEVDLADVETFVHGTTLGLNTVLERKGCLGEAFDIKEFHRQILIDGALPMGVLERKIDEWLVSETG